MPARLGPYDLVRRIGAGGMAEVFLARQKGHAGFEKQLVVKRIHGRLAADKYFVDMFLDEARIAAQINHPNVVQIYDLGEVDGSYYMAMEYLDGENLATI